MCVSIPQSKTVLRLPGRAFSALRNRSLPKQPNSALSIAWVPFSNDAISGTVAPRPLLYCVVNRIGIERILASRINNCEFRTSSSLLNIGGSSFC